MKGLIRLNSRDGTPNFLKKSNTEECKYTLVTPYSYRIGETSEGLVFIDPSGGPLLTIGSIVENYIVKEIEMNEGNPIVVLEL